MSEDNFDDRTPEMRLTEVAYDLRDVLIELRTLRAENEDLREYKQKYFELLDESVNHGREMAGQVLTLLLNRGEFPNEEEKEKDIS